MTAVAAEAAVVVDNGRETSGETSLWHGAAAGAAARVDPLLRRISGLTRFDKVSCGRWLVACHIPYPMTPSAIVLNTLVEHFCLYEWILIQCIRDGGWEKIPKEPFRLRRRGTTKKSGAGR